MIHQCRSEPPATVAGEVMQGFERVREEFERNFSHRKEQGAACSVYFQGCKVVDIWGGVRCSKTSDPWTKGTLSLSFSVTKGMAAAALAVAHSRGLFELDEPVASYWPEFAQQQKQQITVRQLLSHQAGLITVDQTLTAELIADFDSLAAILAVQQPQWKPGSRHGYHALTLGWYQSELIRRTDPHCRSMGEFFQQEVASKLGVEFYIGLPSHVEPERVSRIDGFHRLEMLGHLSELPVGMVLSGIWPNSLVSKSVRVLSLSNPAEINAPQYRAVEMPAANGIGQAQAVARVYDALARGGDELGITEPTWRELIAPALAPTQGTRDAIMKIDTRYGFGFSRPSGAFQFGVDNQAFGCPGAGGSFGMADPAIELGYAYLTNKMGFRLFDDPREKALRDACYDCIAKLQRHQNAA